MAIHPTAIIDPTAELDSSVEIGPWTLIGPGVRIGAGTTVGAHSVIEGPTVIGRDNRIWHHVSLGCAPQDKKYAGEPTTLEIGDRNTVREFCTFNRGTAQDAGATRIGDDNWVMANVHIAHDCQVGNHTIFANNVALAGHVHIGDWAILGGYTAVHQFVKVGAHVMAGIQSHLVKDVPPYVMTGGTPTKPHGINAEGLKRRGFSTEAIARIRHAYKLLYSGDMLFEEAKRALLAESEGHAELTVLTDFLAVTTRGIIR
jgi:UDP-N-acetylglucosamine acyltransferase